MNIYNELLDAFINLIFGSREAFNEVVTTTPIITNNRLSDLINSIIVNLPNICTIIIIVIMFIAVISLFYFVFILFKEMPNEETYKRKRVKRK